MKNYLLFLLSLLAVSLLKPMTLKKFLHYAEVGNLKKVKEGIDAHIDVNFKDSFGRALISAAANGYEKIVEELIKAKVDSNFQDEIGYTALMWAVINGDEEIVKDLLIKANADPDIQSQWGSTALIMATKRRHIKTVKELVDAGAHLNLQDDFGNTALIWAAKKGYTKIVKELIKAHAGLDIQNEDGDTVLIRAVREGFTDIVEKLIKAKADLSIQNRVGGTALLIGAHKMDINIEKLFLNVMSERLKLPHTPELNEFMDADMRKALSQIDLKVPAGFQMLKEFDRFVRKHPEDFPGLEKEIKSLMNLAMKYQVARRGTRPFKEMKEYIRTSR